MKLDIEFSADSFGKIRSAVENWFHQKLRIEREDLSLFESYRLFATTAFIPELWKYRVVCRDRKYHFGRVCD